MSIKTEEGTHALPDGVKLYTKSWIPADSPKAVLIFIHGFSDHCNRYAEFFPNLASRGILLHSFDQRGWGRSVTKPSEKGLTGPTTQVLNDMTSFIRAHLPSSAPLFLMGHSMGGNEVLTYAAVGPEDVKKQIVGYIASAPHIRLDPASEPNRFTVFAGRIASKVMPKRQLFNQLDPSFQCHDEAMNQDWANDPLCHDTGTLEGLAGLLDRAANLDRNVIQHKDDGNMRIFIGHGTGDRCTSHEASKDLFERLEVKDKTLKLYEGCYHCSE
ncbi:hypothetical protein MMC25_001484 [Agyrium rufum]|nr:hypothetical protein [Agyrium rufum]